jgi:hypothetical protein
VCIEQEDEDGRITIINNKEAIEVEAVAARTIIKEHYKLAYSAPIMHNNLLGDGVDDAIPRT